MSDPGFFARQNLVLGEEVGDVIRNTRILVVGVGAGGNELLKNLVLMGFGNFTLVDFDPIENLNKFMEMLKKEQHKVNPPPRDDDSVAEITDLEEQFILSKYYKKENPEFYKK